MKIIDARSGPYITIRQADAVAVARLERDTLLLRAAEGGACAPRWRHAARIADRIVAELAAGRGAAAVPHMYALGRAWHAAAQCKGYPSPLAADDDLAALHAKLEELVRKQREQSKWLRWGTYATIAGVIVAAAKLGVISIPYITKRKAAPG